MEILAQTGIGVAVFIATNVDDIVLRSVFFSDPHFWPRSIVAGPFLGIGALLAASVGGALTALAIPEGWIGFLGLVPLGIGLHRLGAVRSTAPSAEADAQRIRPVEDATRRRTSSQALAVAGVTVANGGDNLGAYIPLVASARRAIPIYAIVFAVMTALWRFIGFRLVSNRVTGKHLRRCGHTVLPCVLVALGVYILAGARMPW
jgi:cadmium resistance protein CadD (predicted permease)